jgi:riboflavin kinase/FMN adenylyltransferase
VKIYNSIEAFKKVRNAVVTTGTFDGVHEGHRVIINQLKSIANKIGGETVLLTFFPHPRMVLYPDDNDLRLIDTINERKQLLAEAGIDHLIIHPFSKEFSRLSSLDFVRNILVNQLGVHTLVIGYDHHFGRNREGSFEHLKEFGPLYGFEVEEISAQEVQQVNVSSTKIRVSLSEGEIISANQFLGHPYSLAGTIVDGDKLGREIGFPTANIKVKEWYKLIPSNGVYAVKILLDDIIYKGMLNIGTRPTVNGKEKTIEVNIFNFNADIYTKALKVEFYERIRDEQKFESLNDLKKQLDIDKEKSIQALS